MSKSKLTPKQQLFVKEYLVDLNATQACIRAGYSKPTANRMGTYLLSNPVLKRLIQEGMDKRHEKVRLTADEVLKEIEKLALVDFSKAYDEKGNLLLPHQMPEEIRKAVGGIETRKLRNGAIIKKLKFWDKTKALELYGRHLKLFTDKHEHSGKDGVPLDTAPKVVIMLPAKNPIEPDEIVKCEDKDKK